MSKTKTSPKTCPFCGASPVLRSNATNIWLNCENDNCAINSVAKSRKDATENWNRRVGILVTDEIVRCVLESMRPYYCNEAGIRLALSAAFSLCAQ